MDELMTVEYICLVAGPLIAGLVSLAKSISIVWEYPKVTALVLSILTAVISGLTIGSMDWQAIAECTIVPFTAAVATYEVVKTAKKEP